MSQMSNGITPTAEQQKIINAYEDAPPGTMIRVQACAGSGKTTTLGNVLRWAVSQGGRCLATGMANTTIETLQKEMTTHKPFENGNGVFASTLHKIGSFLHPSRSVDGAAYGAAQSAFFVFHGTAEQKVKLVKAMSKLLSPMLHYVGMDLFDQQLSANALSYLDQRMAEEGLEEDLQEELRARIQTALDVYTKSKSFDAMLTLPLLHQKSSPVDFLIVDEAQDLSRLLWEFIFGTLVSATTKIMIVGDQSQAIYGFMGVDVAQSLAHIPCNLFQGQLQELTITECRRCSTSIVLMAQTLVGDLITAQPGKAAGEVTDHVFTTTSPIDLDIVNQFCPGDLVLCSDNLIVAKLAFLCARNDQPIAISSSKSIKRSLLAICDYVIRTEGAEANVNLVKVQAKLIADGKIDKALKTQEWGTWMKAQSTCDELSAFIDAGGFDDVQALRATIDDIMYTVDKNMSLDFKSDTDILPHRVYFSTIFKAKGLGSKNVWWVTEDERNPPNPTALVADLTAARRNMCYVAVTRAKEKLSFLGARPFATPAPE